MQLFNLRWKEFERPLNQLLEPHDARGAMTFWRRVAAHFSLQKSPDQASGFTRIAVPYRAMVGLLGIFLFTFLFLGQVFRFPSEDFGRMFLVFTGCWNFSFAILRVLFLDYLGRSAQYRMRWTMLLGPMQASAYLVSRLKLGLLMLFLENLCLYVYAAGMSGASALQLVAAAPFALLSTTVPWP